MDDKKRTARYWIAFFILAVFLVILFVWNVNAGSIHLSVGEILNQLQADPQIPCGCHGKNKYISSTDWKPSDQEF